MLLGRPDIFTQVFKIILQMPNVFKFLKGPVMYIAEPRKGVKIQCSTTTHLAA